MKTIRVIFIAALCCFMLGAFTLALHAKNEKITAPKEPGAYIKTNKGLIRLLPNIVFDEKGVFFLEANDPAHFFMKDVQYFVLYGKHDISVLTLNPMLFLQPSAVGKPRFAFGKSVDSDIKSQGTGLYTIKPKGLLGRGYYSIWINETAWDFILD